MAAMLAAVLENPSLYPSFATMEPNAGPVHPPFRFAILAAGFKPADPVFAALFDKKLRTPSLHILGRADTIVGEGERRPAHCRVQLFALG